MSDQEEKELFMIDTFQQLPKANKLTAQYLFEHLRRYDIVLITINYITLSL